MIRRLLATALVALPLAARAQRATVRVENTLAIARADETIALPWATVTSLVPGARAGAVRVLDAVGREVVSQAIDADGNGAADSLLFQGSFAPGEAKLFTLESGAPTAPAKARVYVTHTVPRDDVAWESDRIAYRIYGQGLWKVDSLLSSGVDVWVKRVRDPIVEKWYAKGHDAYHRDTGEGADFYDVGQTLGAGGTAIWRGGKLWRAANFKSYRILANGPVRALFELTYEPWDADGARVTEIKRVAIDAGQNLNHVTSTFTAVAGGAGELPIAIGFVKRPHVVGVESKASEWAWLTEWGPLTPKDGGHGELGTALLIPRDHVDDWKETADHYLAITHASSGSPLGYYIGAGWTDSGDFRDLRDWYGYLDQMALRLATPLRVTTSAATTSAR